jgi:hypothetical protein
VNKKLRAKLTAKRKRIYRAFIADRRTKEHTLRKGQSERHHIHPRSLGGGDEPANLIRLSFNDHFFAHVLLCRIYGGSQVVALVRMLGRKRKDRYLRGRLARRRYEWIARANSEQSKAGNKARWRDEGFRKRMSVMSKAMWRDEEYRKNILMRRKAYWTDPKVRASHSIKMLALGGEIKEREARSARMTAQMADPKARTNLSTKMKAQWENKLHRNNISAKNKGKNFTLGYDYWKQTNPNGNPRHPGTHGFRSMEIIINNPGISRADYFARGGRNNDLRWDLAHNHVRLDKNDRIWPLVGKASKSLLSKKQRSVRRLKKER